MSPPCRYRCIKEFARSQGDDDCRPQVHHRTPPGSVARPARGTECPLYNMQECPNIYEISARCRADHRAAVRMPIAHRQRGRRHPTWRQEDGTNGQISDFHHRVSVRVQADGILSVNSMYCGSELMLTAAAMTTTTTTVGLAVDSGFCPPKSGVEIGRKFSPHF